MVRGVVDFVNKKKNPKSVQSVRILIFQKAMMAEFHKTMKNRKGEEVEGKNGFIAWCKGTLVIFGNKLYLLKMFYFTVRGNVLFHLFFLSILFRIAQKNNFVISFLWINFFFRNNAEVWPLIFVAVIK